MQVPVVILVDILTNLNSLQNSKAIGLPSTASTSGLVRQFPSHDRRFVDIPVNKGFDIIFVCSLDKITVND